MRRHSISAAALAGLALVMLLAGGAWARGGMRGGPGGPGGPGMGEPPPGGPPGMGPGGPGFPGGALERLLPRPDRWSDLGLTDAQQDQVEALHAEEVKAAVRADADARLAELDLAGLIEAGKGNEPALDAQVARVAAARAEMLRAHVHMIEGVWRLLTPEQRRKLKRLSPPPR